MIILTIRTDKPETEIGLFDDDKQLTYEKWQAHRELSDTIHIKFAEILNKLSIEAENVKGIVVYEGPGSFTGLRIGLSVANAMAYALSIPIVAAGGSDWLEAGIKNLAAGKNDKIALPKYGAEPNITKPRK